MKNRYDEAIRFKNGNINIKFSKYQLEDIKKDRFSAIECLSWILSDCDCDFIGDEYCLSNWEMGATIYSWYSDKVFILNFSDIDNVLMKGKTLKLYATNPTEDDRELINNY